MKIVRIDFGPLSVIEFTKEKIGMPSDAYDGGGGPDSD